MGGADIRHAVISGMKRGKIPLRQHGAVFLAELSQPPVPAQQFQILVAPRVRPAVERVAVALKTGLVAVVDAGHPRQRVLHQRREPQQTQAVGAAFLCQMGRALPLAAVTAHRIPGEHRQGAFRVVRADVVHQQADHLRRVIFKHVEDNFHLRAGIAASEEAEDRVAEWIIHDAVELAAQQIAAALAVGAFIGGVLPDLAEHKGVRILTARRFGDAVDEAVRELVGDVETPAGRPGRDPFLDNPGFPGDIVLVLGIFLHHVGERLEVPPAGVLVRPFAEGVPGIVGRFLRLVRARLRIPALTVEIDAVAAGMVEHAVDNDADPIFSGLPAEAAEILL